MREVVEKGDRSWLVAACRTALAREGGGGGGLRSGEGVSRAGL